MSDVVTPTPNGPHIKDALQIGVPPAIKSMKGELLPLVTAVLGDDLMDLVLTALTTQAITGFISALADAGWRLQPPNTVLFPTTRGQAEMMVLLGKKWLQQNAAPSSPEGG